MRELALSSTNFQSPESENALRILKNILHARYPDIVISGSLGTGKTSLVFFALHLLCCSSHDVRVAIIRKERSTIYSTVAETIRKMLEFGYSKSPLSPLSAYGGATRPVELHYHAGSKVLFGGLDDVDKVLGAEPNIIFCNQVERFTEVEYNLLASRLRGLGGFLNPFTKTRATLMLGDANPQGPRHWLLARKGLQTVGWFDTALSDNVGYFTQGAWTEAGVAYKKRLDSAFPNPGYLRDRMVHGLWAAPSGMIFPEFSYEKHVRPISQLEIPKGWRFGGTVDYGMTHPSSFILHAASRCRRKVWHLASIHKTGLTAHELGEQIRPLLLKWGASPKTLLTGDVSGEGNAVLRRMGFHVKDADKRVLHGISVMHQYLSGSEDREFLINENSLSHAPDPALVSANAPTWLAEELLEYAHLPVEKQNSGTSKDDYPHKAKGGDDAVDATRYYLVDIARGRGKIPSIIASVNEPKTSGRGVFAP